MFGTRKKLKYSSDKVEDIILYPACKLGILQGVDVSIIIWGLFSRIRLCPFVIFVVSTELMSVPAFQFFEVLLLSLQKGRLSHRKLIH